MGVLIETMKNPSLFGRVVELVYTADLKSAAERIEGSSPSPTTNVKLLRTCVEKK